MCLKFTKQYPDPHFLKHCRTSKELFIDSFDLSWDRKQLQFIEAYLTNISQVYLSNLENSLKVNCRSFAQRNMKYKYSLQIDKLVHNNIIFKLLYFMNRENSKPV